MFEERQSELDLSSPVMRRPRGDAFALHNSVTGARRFCMVHADRMKGNGHELQQGKLIQIVGGNFHHEGSSALEQAAQRSRVISIPADIRNSTGQGPEPSDLSWTNFTWEEGQDDFPRSLPT